MPSRRVLLVAEAGDKGLVAEAAQAHTKQIPKYPRASTGSQVAPRQSTAKIAGNPYNPAMSPHATPKGICHTKLIVEEKWVRRGWEHQSKPSIKKHTGNCLRVQNYMLLTHGH